MLSELRAGLILLAAFVFHLIIVGICALSLVMMPDRWSDRTRPAGEGRANEGERLSVAA